MAKPRRGRSKERHDAVPAEDKDRDGRAPEEPIEQESIQITKPKPERPRKDLEGRKRAGEKKRRRRYQ